MAKATSTFAILALAVGLAACGNREEPANIETAPIESAAVPEITQISDLDAYYAERGGPPWYTQAEKPTDLRGVLIEDRRFLSDDNIGYRMMADQSMCATFREVGLACDYNTRTSLSLFLTVNGKGLFPASGGTDPYFTEHETPDVRPDDYYIGRPVQNRMLREAVERNAHLFKDGNLTAEAVRASWR